VKGWPPKSERRNRDSEFRAEPEVKDLRTIVQMAMYDARAFGPVKVVTVAAITAPIAPEEFTML
jgi:hypothetical protein